MTHTDVIPFIALFSNSIAKVAVQFGVSCTDVHVCSEIDLGLSPHPVAYCIHMIHVHGTSLKIHRGMFDVCWQLSFWIDIAVEGDRKVSTKGTKTKYALSINELLDN